MSRRTVAGLCVLALTLLMPMAAAAATVIRLGTLAPQGSPWHDAILQMNAEWQRITGGAVSIKVYSGVLGDEPEMLRKMRLGEIQAVAMSGAGLALLDPAVGALQVPLLFDSYEELDYVRDRIAPAIETAIAEHQRLKVLNWSDAGWVHFFATEAVRTPQQISRLRLLTSPGSPGTEALYKEFGYRVVPLPYTDVLMSLETGLIEAVQGPPLFAMLEQWFGIADHMVRINWTPLVGATVIRLDVWERLPAEWHQPMLAAAQQAGLELRGAIRRLGDEAVPEMQKRGLEVIDPTPAEVELWRAQAEQAYDRLRGTFVPADLFDEAKRLRDEYRNAHPAR